MNVGSAIGARSQRLAASTHALADYLVNNFRIFAWVTLATIPLLFGIRHFKPVRESSCG
jgi:hypothetical protein